MLGHTLQLSDVDVPLCAIACETDHIAAWKDSYRGVQMMGSKNKTFIMTQSGHIAGIVNPPSQEQVRPLYQRRSDAERRRLAGGRRVHRRVVVAALGDLAGQAVRQEDSRPHTGRFASSGSGDCPGTYVAAKANALIVS